jgi:hypothetical protein
MFKNTHLVLLFSSALLWGCTGGSSSSDSVTVEGDVPIAYIKRPVSALGNPTDSVPDNTAQGGDLYIRQKSSPSASESNVTGSYTQGQGDVSDPEVSYDGTKLLFAMRGPNDQYWGIWEFDTKKLQLTKISCDARGINNVAIPGDDVDPAYLPDGRIVFASNRQEGSWRQLQAQGITPYKYVDEYEREAVTALHVMAADGQNCKQISFNQSHDRNPTVRSGGDIMYSRWDHVGGRNQFSIFKINADGTNPFILYGAHDLDDIYLHPREMPDGRLVSTYMPLTGTREGGSIEIIDATNYSANQTAGTSSPPANQLGERTGQFQASRLLFPDRSQGEHTAMRGRGVSPLGRYSTPYPLWDGTNRMLVVFTPSQPTAGTNALGQATTVEGPPKYGIYMLDLSDKTLRPVVLPQDGYFFSDPVALQARPLPKTSGNFTPDTSLGTGMGLIEVNSVYDTDSLGRMGNAVLASGETIPLNNGSKPDIANLKLPGTTAFNNRVARFFRITKAVPTPRGLSRQAIGETEFEMQQIVGYGVVEPDGSIRTKVPADTAFNITALDQNGRAFTPHVNWIQAREGERRFCKGCHSSRLGTSASDGTTNAQGTLLNDPAVVGAHPDGNGVWTTGSSTMAVTRSTARDIISNILIDPEALNLKRDIAYQDFWTSKYNAITGATVTAQSAIAINYSGLTTTAPAIKGPGSCATTWSSKDCAIVINYPDHIQPIWTKSCLGACHTGTSPAGGLDLSDTAAGEFGRTISYQKLLVGEPVLDPVTNLPQIRVNGDEVTIVLETAAVEPGSGRGSRLLSRLFEQPLRAGSLVNGSGQPVISRPVCEAPPSTVCVNNSTWTNHSAYLNPSEKRLVTEWIDLGAQYYNDPFNSNGSLRSNAALLSETVFRSCVRPILQVNCASCHQAAGNPLFVPNPGNRFVLTGNATADFSATASMVTNLAVPGSSLLLYRPSRSQTDTPTHPGVTPVLPAGSANYNTLQAWIAGTSTTTACN